jgi:predicted Zn-dependent protease with MMP-like domain
VESLHCLRTTGMPIRQMLHFAERVRQDASNIPQRIALNHRKAVLDHIAEQQEYLKAVEAKIAHYRNQ